jgi:adenylylsulfate kinase-like enzyme
MTDADGLRSANVVWQPGEITREARWQALGGPGATVWFTGLPSSGKSTVASAVEAKLLAEGRPAYVLDGDNLRHGLNGNLGFSPEDRRENVRRTAEVARAAHDARGLRFIEVWVSTPLEECERRDTKGLYAKARAGEIPDFTGIGQPYEEPESPDLEVTFAEPLEVAAERVLAALRH